MAAVAGNKYMLLLTNRQLAVASNSDQDPGFMECVSAGGTNTVRPVKKQSKITEETLTLPTSALSAPLAWSPLQ